MKVEINGKLYIMSVLNTIHKPNVFKPAILGYTSMLN